MDANNQARPEKTVSGRFTDLLATVLAIARNRCALAAAELEEEARRVLSWFILAMAAIFFLSLSVLFFALFIVVFFWDTYRIAAILGLFGLFTLIGLICVCMLRGSVKSRPGFLELTRAEITRDMARLKTVHRKEVGEQ